MIITQRRKVTDSGRCKEKYDVACTSSGSSRRGKKGELGNGEACGIGHSFAADGRCISFFQDPDRQIIVPMTVNIASTVPAMMYAAQPYATGNL